MRQQTTPDHENNTAAGGRGGQLVGPLRPRVGQVVDVMSGGRLKRGLTVTYVSTGGYIDVVGFGCMGESIPPDCIFACRDKSW